MKRELYGSALRLAVARCVSVLFCALFCLDQLDCLEVKLHSSTRSYQFIVFLPFPDFMKQNLQKLLRIALFVFIDCILECQLFHLIRKTWNGSFQILDFVTQSTYKNQMFRVIFAYTIAKRLPILLVLTNEFFPFSQYLNICTIRHFIGKVSTSKFLVRILDIRKRNTPILHIHVNLRPYTLSLLALDEHC